MQKCPGGRDHLANQSCEVFWPKVALPLLISMEGGFFTAQITKAALVIVEAPHLGVEEIMGTEGPDVGEPRGGPTPNFLGVT